mmetsp:Transcript_11281/g.18988  ORF Transcript_11281/g.18988 Transcript_11281/m.18988 type:complete len:135 (-) Transcript_11281:353-757(-)
MKGEKKLQKETSLEYIISKLKFIEIYCKEQIKRDPSILGSISEIQLLHNHNNVIDLDSNGQLETDEVVAYNDSFHRSFAGYLKQDQEMVSLKHRNQFKEEGQEGEASMNYEVLNMPETARQLVRRNSGRQSLEM